MPKRGLGNWDALKEVGDNAMGDGLDSSLDVPVEEALNDTEQSGTLEFLKKRMRFNPRQTEQDILDKLNGQLDRLIGHSYGDIDQTIDKFFARLEELGDFSKLEPVELERMILELQKVIYQATDVVSALYNDAYFADRVQQDEFWSAYRTLDGKVTMGDRNAYAYSESQDSRFFYYYSFLLWRRMHDKLAALREFQKTLEWFRSRSIKDKPFG